MLFGNVKGWSGHQDVRMCGLYKTKCVCGSCIVYVIINAFISICIIIKFKKCSVQLAVLERYELVPAAPVA